MSQELTHFDASGQAHMVDVAAKAETHRRAVACGRITMQPATFGKLAGGSAAKGDVLGVAWLAGIMASKQTGSLIPLCHPIPLPRVSVDFELNASASSVACTATAETVGRTGVEMEALTGASIAALTVYDMCKAVDRSMQIEQVRLEHKSGGKSGTFQREEPKK